MKDEGYTRFLAECIILGLDPQAILRVSDSLELGIIRDAISDAVKIREIVDNNLAISIASKLAGVF